MQLAVNSWSYRRTFEDKTLDLPGLLDELPVTGVKALEVAGAHFANRSDIYLGELRQRCIDLSITLVGIDLTNDFAWPDPTERERQTRDVIAWMDLVAPLGIRLLHLRTGRGRPDVLPARSQSWVRGCLERLLTEAESRHCTLALDDESRLFDDPVRLAEEFDSPTLKLSINAEQLRLMESELEHVVHVRLNFDKPDGLSDDVLCVISRIASSGHDGIIALEYSGKDGSKDALSGMRRRIEAAG